MNRSLKKFLCTFLSAIMIIQVLPMTVWGAEVQNKTLPEIINTDDSDIEIVQKLSEECTDNQSTYLAEDGSIVKSIEVSESDNSQIAEASVSSDLSNSDGQITIYQEDGIENEPGIYTMSTNDANGIIVNVDTENLGNVFVKSAYVTLHCEETDDNNIHAVPINNDYAGDYSAIEFDTDSDFANITSQNNNTDITLDITKPINSWLTGTSNHGICIYSDDYLTFSNAAVIINYRNISDVDSNIESEIIDMGRAGTVYINDFSCTATIVRNELGLDGYLAPVQIQSILNPFNDTISLTGSNFRTNYESTIAYNSESNHYIWNNCEGENLNFTLKNTVYPNKTYTAVNTAGNEFTLTVPISGSANIQNVKITDKDGYEYHFNSYGLLSEILVKGNNSNKIVIDYANTESTHRISSVKDGANRYYKFEYDTNNRLVAIKVTNANNDILKINGTDICINYTYNDKGLLTQVTYPDNEAVEYTYDSADRISTIISNSGNTLKFGYYLADKDIISNYILSDSNENIIENISLKLPVEEENGANGPYRRMFTDNLKPENDNSQIKILDFDKEFNLVYLEDYDNKNYFLDYENGELKNVINDNPSKNLINNGNFTSNITGWSKMSETNAAKINNSERRLRSDAGSLRIKGSETKDSGVVQKISPTDGFKKGEKYIVEAYLNASEAVALTNNKKMGIMIATSENQSGVPVSSDIIAQTDYQPYINTWQLQKQIVTIPEDTDNLYVYLYYGYMPGYCYFDSVKLYKYTDSESETAIDRTAYTYDSNGRLAKETVTEKNIIGTIKSQKEKTYTYNGNNLSSITDNGITTYYNYDSNSLLTSYGYSPESEYNTKYSYNGIGALESIEQIVNQIDIGDVQGIKKMQMNTSYSYEHDNVTEIAHNGFTYSLTYDTLGNISNVSVNDSSIFSFDNQYEEDQVSKITYGDGTSLLYKKYIDTNHYNIVDIYETTQDNPKTSALNYKYEFKYDYDGTLVEYIDKENGTTSIWFDNEHLVYNCVSTTFLNQINTLFKGTISLEDITEIPIYSCTENFNGTIFGQSLSQTNIDIFGKNYSVISSLTNSKTLNTTTKTDRVFFGETDSLANIKTSDDLKDFLNKSNYTVAKTTEDGFGRTTYSSLTSLIDGTGVVNKCSYKDLGSKKTTNLLSEYETYYGGINTTNQEASESAALLYKKYRYEYNSKGQITDVYSVDKNLFNDTTLDPDVIGDGVSEQKIYHYEYDELGQLITEVNLKTNMAIVYRYDAGGNVTERAYYGNGDFLYDPVSNELTLNNCSTEAVSEYNNSSWKDLMTSINGNEITYDGAGNPLNYVGSNLFGLRVSGDMTWSGKNLISFKDTENSLYYEYKYNADGLRTQKKIYSIKSDGSYQLTSSIDYIWENDIIAGYNMSSYENDQVKSFLSVKPIYDNNNSLMGMIYDIPGDTPEETKTITVPVLKDGLGNITDVYTNIADTKLMFHYDYDAYGNCYLNFSGLNFDEINTGSIVLDVILAIIIAIALAAVLAGIVVLAHQNYRGYLYDAETGLYYNQTRYYSPAWCRFINCDDVNVLTKDTGEVLGANLFKYCDNDPINYSDPSGFSKLSNLYDDSLLSLIGITPTDSTKLNISKPSMQNTIDNKIIESSLSLTSQQQEIWEEVFNNNSQTVYKNNGYNYLSSHIDSMGNDKSKMFNSKSKTPYNARASKNN